MTDPNGVASLTSSNVRNPDTGSVLTFTVTDVTDTRYDPSKNLEISAFASYPDDWSVGTGATALFQSFPTPSNPDVWLPYQLAEDADVIIIIHDASGKLVRKLHLGRQVAGAYLTKDKAAHWDGRNEAGERVASGMYFCTMQAGEFSATRKLVIAK